MNINTNKKINYCCNCGKTGHIYRKCLSPIMSLGIILVKLEDNTLKYLLIQRRDTLGFVEFMRGKYNLENIKYIFKLFEIMTESERNKIMTSDFDTLWNNLWMNKNLKQYHNEYDTSKKKFTMIKNGNVMYENNIINFEYINKTSELKWFEPEWGFPKGRRNLKETDLECAVREFEEETGFKKGEYTLININPIEEIFSGTNSIRYKHIYYIAKTLMDKKLIIDKNNFNQVSEISTIKWFNYEDALSKIRPYNLEKKKVLEKLNEFLIKNITLL